MGPKPACFGAFITTFRFSKSELPRTHGHAIAKNIPILENFRRSDQNVHFGESEPNIRKIGNTQDTKMYIFRRKYILSPRKKKYVLHFRKIYASIREKNGDLTMKANFI